MKRFENAKIGDKVISSRKGDGTIMEILGGIEYPISVKFACSRRRIAYAYDGKLIKNDVFPELFWPGGYKFPVNGKEPSRFPDWATNTKVIVWNDCDNNKHRRYFSHWDDDGDCMCFAYGRTEWSAVKPAYGPVPWSNWKLADNKDDSQNKP